MRFALNVCQVVTFVLINIFRCGKKYVVGIGEYNTRVEQIEGFIVNFEQSRNAKEPRSSKRPSQLKKKQNKSSIGNFQNIAH